MADNNNSNSNGFLDGNGVLYLWQKIVNKFVSKETGKGLSTNDYTTPEKDKLKGIAENANNYTHPTYTAKANGLYKVTVDNTGHVSGTAAVEKSDITALGIPDSKTVVNNTLTSTSTTEALAAVKGKELDEKIKAINDNIGNLGGGDMLKSQYDTNNNGKVDKAELADKATTADKFANMSADEFHHYIDLLTFDRSSGISLGSINTDGIITRFTDAYTAREVLCKLEVSAGFILPVFCPSDVSLNHNRLVVELTPDDEIEMTSLPIVISNKTQINLKANSSYIIAVAPHPDENVEGLHGTIIGVEIPVDTTPTEGSTNHITSGAVFTALKDAAVKDHEHGTDDIDGLDEIVEDITEIANGKCTPYVFDIVADLDTDIAEYVAFLNNGTEMSADNQFKGKTLKTGDVFYIRATEVPDYWWDESTKSKQVLETTKVELDTISNDEIDEIIRLVEEG